MMPDRRVAAQTRRLLRGRDSDDHVGAAAQAPGWGDEVRSLSWMNFGDVSVTSLRESHFAKKCDPEKSH